MPNVQVTRSSLELGDAKMRAIVTGLRSIRENEKLMGDQKELIPATLVSNRDVSFREFMNEFIKVVEPQNFKNYCNKDGQFDMGYLYHALQIDPNESVKAFNLQTADTGRRWLIPEIFLDAIRKGVRSVPFTNQIVSQRININSKSVIMPYFNVSNATPEDLEEAETVSLGSISYGDKTVEIVESGIGFKITNDAIKYTSINLLTVFLQDMGVKLGHALQRKAVEVLINGDQANGSEAASTIGVTNAGTLTYADIVRPWIRASLIGRTYDHMVASEQMSNDILNLSEFKDKRETGRGVANISVNTPLPNQSQLFTSVNVPTNQVILLDPRFALMQLTASGLSVETEKIIANGIQATYARITTGFANIFKDSRIILDKSLAFAGNGFPAYMDLVV